MIMSEAIQAPTDFDRRDVSPDVSSLRNKTSTNVGVEPEAEIGPESPMGRLAASLATVSVSISTRARYSSAAASRG